MQEIHKLIKNDYNEYRRIHYWINKYAGKAYKCDNPDCDGTSRYFEWANLNEKYNKTYNEWKMLCRKCHSIMDKSKFCKNGHKRTNFNIKIRGNGNRHCLICYFNEKENNKPKRRIIRSRAWEIIMSQFSHLLLGQKCGRNV